jgi:hypothetical protein
MKSIMSSGRGEVDTGDPCESGLRMHGHGVLDLDPMQEDIPLP